MAKFAEYLLIGKSLGTLAMHLAYQYPGCSAPSVWLTPLMHNAGVQETLLKDQGGLVVYRTQDPAADLGLKDTLQNRHALLEVGGADHSLQVTDTERSIKIMGQYVRALRVFIGS